MDGATVSVAVLSSRTEAELIVGMLRSHGVRAAVSADDAGGQYPQMQIEGVRVLVAPSDEASARRLLAAADDTLSWSACCRSTRPTSVTASSKWSAGAWPPPRS
jgi:hypothetical protein